MFRTTPQDRLVKHFQRATVDFVQAQKWLWHILLVALCSGIAGPSVAQSEREPVQELERKLDQSLRNVEALTERVRELESRVPAQVESETAAESDVSSPEESHFDDFEPASAGAPALGLLKGFADTGAGFSGGGGNKGFANGTLDLYLTPQLSDHVKALLELVFEYDDVGDLATDLERLQIGYAFNNAANVWLGRFHTPFGYWNTAFHHGRQLQTSLLRPRMIDFEDAGGVFPVHTVGLWSTGSLRVSESKLEYDFFVGNNPSIEANTLNPNNVGSPHPGLSAGFNLGYQIAGDIDALTVGLHGYRAEVRDDSVVANVSQVNMLGAYTTLDSTAWELIAEYYAFRNKDTSGASGHFDSWAAFAQLGRHIERWTPYARIEKASLDQADNYFALQASGRSYERQALGLRYDLTSNSALKLEANHTKSGTLPSSSFNELQMQWAIRF